MGTRIDNLQLVRVIDGDTIDLTINTTVERVRLTGIDTEESLPGGDKPVTKMGKEAARLAKEYFRSSNGVLPKVSIEFDTDDPVELCLQKHRDNFGRLLCYVHYEDENFNLKLIKEGWSPYFEKYGRSRLFHKECMSQEAKAQAANLHIWDPSANAGGPSRDYSSLVSWWSLRALVVEDYRREGENKGVLSVRLDYEKIKEASENGEEITVFCDLQDGINQWVGGGALIYAGSKYHKFNLWIPDSTSERAVTIINLVEKRYSALGKRGYVYVKGKTSKYNNTPQIQLDGMAQLFDYLEAP